MHAFRVVTGVDAVDACLVPVALVHGDEQVRERSVDTFHEGVGRQSCPDDQLAGAVKQPPGVGVVPVSGRNPRDADQIGAAGGERVPALAGDPSEGSEQLGIFDGGPRTAAGTARHELQPLVLGERLERFVDAQR